MRWYWAAWLLLGFLVPELVALFSGHPENTLSETVWNWFHVKPGSKLRKLTIRRLLLLFFMVWLTGHLAFGWWSKL